METANAIKEPFFPTGETNGESTASPSGSVAAVAAVAARENVAAAINNPDTPRGRGRPRKDASASAGNNPALSKNIERAIQEQVNAVCSPEAWAALLASPADVGLALTGRKHWEVSEQERKTLGATGAAAARCMMITDPKSLALLMVSSALLSVYVPRMIAEAKHLRSEKKEPEKK